MLPSIASIFGKRDSRAGGAALTPTLSQGERGATRRVQGEREGTRRVQSVETRGLASLPAIRASTGNLTVARSKAQRLKWGERERAHRSRVSPRPLFLLFSVVISMAAAMALLTSSALAAGLPAAGPLPMQGLAQIDRSGRTPQFLLSADAVDGSGYHLEATMAPVTSSRGGQGRSGEREGSGGRGGQGGQESGIVGLTGVFTLTASGLPAATGGASGQLDQTGAGSLNLTGDQGTVNLTAAFAVDGNGNLSLDLAGTLPGVTTPQGQGVSQQSLAASGQAQPVDHTFWYIARAAGLSAYLLLWLNVCLGLGVHTRIVDSLMARWRSFDLHQFTAVLATGLLGLHAVSLLGDRYIGFNPGQLLVPFASPYRPAWTALGVIAAYLMVVILASSLLRKHLGYRTWRTIHYFTFGAYLLALGHGLFAGTDTVEPWARAMYWSTAALVGMLTVRRFRLAGERRPARAGSRSTASGTP